MREKHGGFTLVELLATIAIIGVLVALLMPAIQAAREASRRAQCQNQLKQIGLGLQNHHAARNLFPAGNVTKTSGICHGDSMGGVGYPSEDGANWLISLLPYVEQDALYAQYDLSDFNESFRNAAVRQTVVSLYVCPAEFDAGQLEVPATGPACVPALNLKYMPGSYRAMTGRSDGFQFLDSGDVQQYPVHWRGAIHTVGIFGYKPESSKTIQDGLSNTLMAGESTTRTAPSMRTFWAYSYSHYSLSAATAQSRTWLGDYTQCVAHGGIGASLPCRRAWGGQHPGGINSLRCDGSVHFFADTIDPELFAQLATIDGKETAKWAE